MIITQEQQVLSGKSEMEPAGTSDSEEPKVNVLFKNCETSAVVEDFELCYVQS